jgi:TPR repeat protein
MKKLSILFTLVLFTLTMGVDAAEQGGKMVAGDEFQYNDQTLDDKLGYLYKISLEQPQAVFEVAKVGASIDYISKALQHYTFDRSYTIALRYFRAQGLHQINLQRHENDQPINIAEIELALADFDDVLKDKPSNVILHKAGLMASIYLQDKNLAASYFIKCAEQGHLGCINSMANNYYFGRAGFNVDLDKSVVWHKKVIEGGIRFNCAAVHSSHVLAHIQDSLPMVKTGKTSLQWIAISHQLLEQLEQSEAGAYDLCDANELFLFEYTMFVDDQSADKTLLQRALQYENDQVVKSFIQAIIDDKPIDLMLTIVNTIEHQTRRCDSYFDLLLLARAQGDSKNVKQLMELLTLQDPEHCSFPLATINQMQAAGVWD